MEKEKIKKLKEYKYILWLDYGVEGWQPTGFDSIKKALEADKYVGSWIITKNFNYIVNEQPTTKD